MKQKGQKIMNLIIDKEFEKLIPPLSDEEFDLLKHRILSDGEIYNPIITWNGVIIDGHHRYKILQEHPEIRSRVQVMHFENRNAAIVWICDNQLGRRNISQVQRSVLLGKRYKAEKECAKFRGNQYTKDVVGVQNESTAPERDKTAKKIASEAGVSVSTIKRDEKFIEGLDASEEICPGIYKEIGSGAITPTKEAVIAVGEAAPEDREKMVANLRTPRKLTEEEKVQRKEKRDRLRSIERLYQSHLDHFLEKRSPMTAEQALPPMFSGIENHLELYDMIIEWHPDLLTDQRHRTQLLKMFGVIEDYINRIKENRYEPYTSQRSKVFEEKDSSL